MNSLEHRKEALRAQVKSELSKVRVSWSKLAEHFEFEEGDIIGLFQPLKDEPEIQDFASELNVCWPKITDQAQSEMSFFSSNEFEKSDLGFLEPGEFSKEVSKKQISMILVPGLAFDFKGQRLGRGKGFYDRYLSDYKGITVGVCSTARFLDEPIPVDQKFDVSVQYVLTEQFLYQVNPERKVG